ncbi:MAG TPA: hypothetical protein VH419_05835 [Nocardioidaceae bacterium]|jgi:hypothetical protein
MFNVSVRRVVVSAIAIAATSAVSFGASSEAWGGKSVEWGKVGSGHHSAKSVEWGASSVEWGLVKNSGSLSVEWG